MLVDIARRKLPRLRKPVKATVAAMAMIAVIVASEARAVRMLRTARTMWRVPASLRPHGYSRICVSSAFSDSPV